MPIKRLGSSFGRALRRQSTRAGKTAPQKANRRSRGCTQLVERRIMFVHFFHEQTLTLYEVKQRIRPSHQTVRLLRDALYLVAFISPDEVIIPSTDIVQSSV